MGRTLEEEWGDAAHASAPFTGDTHRGDGAHTLRTPHGSGLEVTVDAVRGRSDGKKDQPRLRQGDRGQERHARHKTRGARRGEEAAKEDGTGDGEREERTGGSRGGSRGRGEERRRGTALPLLSM